MDSGAQILPFRPAPVQVNYLGYPGTLGNGYMDYILADRHVIPPEQQRFYDERVIYLPDAYLPPAAGLQIAERTPTRTECGLPEDGVVFCSFNHDYKILPGLSQAPGVAEPRPISETGFGHGCGHNLLGAAAMSATGRGSPAQAGPASNRPSATNRPRIRPA